MFTVLVTAHLIMTEIIHAGWVKKITMRHLPEGHPRDFVKLGRPSAIVSVALVVVGMAFVVYKGDRIKGIDFSGGDEVTLQYGEQLDVAQIRHVADAKPDRGSHPDLHQRGQRRP